ncbi:hypothetical protein C6P40_003630 [Pichia californica]|uniref:Uncharacterized protein n=1 Tax=Pichia californica TaxID=460514 RepID=A0A9P6WH58_9ASCO|nr:hypothetical protein C6P42_002230 [[Candida] californica]KAG0686654.1 hypothetical protein C6P40_003630 [[Candida] californica]
MTSIVITKADIDALSCLYPNTPSENFTKNFTFNPIDSKELITEYILEWNKKNDSKQQHKEEEQEKQPDHYHHHHHHRELPQQQNSSLSSTLPFTLPFPLPLPHSKDFSHLYHKNNINSIEKSKISKFDNFKLKFLKFKNWFSIKSKLKFFQLKIFLINNYFAFIKLFALTGFITLNYYLIIFLLVAFI